jgi:hypothetical protein
MRATAPLADAALPPGVHLNGDQTSQPQAGTRPLNEKRAQLSLDGVWRFPPPREDRHRKRDGDTSRCRVTGGLIRTSRRV